MQNGYRLLTNVQTSLNVKRTHTLQENFGRITWQNIDLHVDRQRFYSKILSIQSQGITK